MLAKRQVREHSCLVLAQRYFISGHQKAVVVLNALVRVKPFDEMPRRWLGPPRGLRPSRSEFSGDQLQASLDSCSMKG